MINGVASFRWSFGPLSAWGSIESTTIPTTHPSLYPIRFGGFRPWENEKGQFSFIFEPNFSGWAPTVGVSKVRQRPYQNLIKTCYRFCKGGQKKFFNFPRKGHLIAQNDFSKFILKNTP